MVVCDQMPTHDSSFLIKMIYHAFHMLSENFLVSEFVFELNIEKKDMLYSLLSRLGAFAVQIKRASVATVRKIVAQDIVHNVL